MILFSNYIGPYVELSEARLGMKLADPAIRMNDGATLTVLDTESALKCRILICHSSDEKSFKLEGGKPSHYEEISETCTEEAVSEEAHDAQRLKRDRDEVVDLTEPSSTKKAKLDDQIDLIE
jgi:hypothetical protein